MLAGLPRGDLIETGRSFFPPGSLLLYRLWEVCFFSNVMEFAPCILCWYQRICLFPLVVILACGLFPLDRGVVKYALPLAVIGWLLAAYHNLLYAELIPDTMQPCSKGVSCTEEYIELFGFLSIPLLALLAFSALIFILITLKRRRSE